MSTKKKGKKVLSVDFTDVEAGTGGGRLLPEDRYTFEVEDSEIDVGEESGKEYVKLTLVVQDGEFKGTKAWDNLSTQPKALWKLRGFMESAGLPTEDGAMDIDPDEFVGLIVQADVIHEDYKGKPKHRINGYAPADDTPAETTSTPKKKNPAAESESTWKIKQKVAFMDGKKRLEGVISKIDDDTITVRVGSDEYEMSASDLEAA